RAPAGRNGPGSGSCHHHEAARPAVGPCSQRNGPAEGRNDRNDHIQRFRSQYLERTLMTKRIPALMAVLLLTGCQSQTIREIGNAPSMSPIGSGLQYAQAPQMASYPKQPRQLSNGYSLWSDSQSALFKDARALNVGDILTVDIRINDRASFDNETERSRTNATSLGWGLSVSNLFGWTPGPSTGDLGHDSNTDSKSRGSTERSEKLKLLVAAVVAGLLENGNLLISGSQEVRVNH